MFIWCSSWRPSSYFNALSIAPNLPQFCSSPWRRPPLYSQESHHLRDPVAKIFSFVGFILKVAALVVPDFGLGLQWSSQVAIARRREYSVGIRAFWSPELITKAGSTSLSERFFSQNCSFWSRYCLGSERTLRDFSSSLGRVSCRDLLRWSWRRESSSGKSLAASWGSPYPISFIISIIGSVCWWFLAVVSPFARRSVCLTSTMNPKAQDSNHLLFC